MLYKIDAIEPKDPPDYFRFTQSFELLPETGDAKERHGISDLINQDNIQQSITAKLEQLCNRNNLKELLKSMNELRDDDTLRILLNGKFNIAEFIKVYQKYEQKNGLYFLGQIYHQAKENKKDSNKVFDEIEIILDNLKSSDKNKKLYWIAPSDIYWAKQRKIHDKLQSLINKQKRGYKFHLYLPLSEKQNRRERQEWKNEFKNISDEVLYGFYEGFLDGNTEILFLEGEFAVVCYHTKLPAYPVTLPIGFFITEKNKVSSISKLAINYLSEYLSEDMSKDFGLLSKIN
ncbi:hypothetical protein [Suttonella ornithocola]|uniref:Uncharacterized protein n=1 Tax=Suttonella ornithocola TaxID=279832 RepID=A0A380N1M3_9GAMM|nr:hypothetical protein [Suttonella ornithocola]SUO97801.1 Uncharacterised protein [Suttonella ornithocola]